ncbi:MAG: hypothetical protein O3A57_12285, partial [Bacteroidetes bacterium]|nr:hypothetical protein [Bacteroidota bacterium]
LCNEYIAYLSLSVTLAPAGQTTDIVVTANNAACQYNTGMWPIEYTWDINIAFGDGNYDDVSSFGGYQFSHAYGSAGNFTIVSDATCTCGFFASDDVSQGVTIPYPPPPSESDQLDLLGSADLTIAGVGSSDHFRLDASKEPTGTPCSTGYAQFSASGQTSMCLGGTVGSGTSCPSSFPVALSMDGGSGVLVCFVDDLPLDPQAGLVIVIPWLIEAAVYASAAISASVVAQSCLADIQSGDGLCALAHEALGTISSAANSTISAAADLLGSIYIEMTDATNVSVDEDDFDDAIEELEDLDGDGVPTQDKKIRNIDRRSGSKSAGEAFDDFLDTVGATGEDTESISDPDFRHIKFSNGVSVGVGDHGHSGPSVQVNYPDGAKTKVRFPTL